jgi:hypothetical protein
MNVRRCGTLQLGYLLHVVLFKDIGVVQQQPEDARIRRKRAYEGLFEAGSPRQHGLARDPGGDGAR